MQIPREVPEGSGADTSWGSGGFQWRYLCGSGGFRCRYLVRFQEGTRWGSGGLRCRYLVRWWGSGGSRWKCVVRFRRVPEQIPCEVPEGSGADALWNSKGFRCFLWHKPFYGKNAEAFKLLGIAPEFILFWKVLHFDIFWHLGVTGEAAAPPTWGLGISFPWPRWFRETPWNTRPLIAGGQIPLRCEILPSGHWWRLRERTRSLSGLVEATGEGFARHTLPPVMKIRMLDAQIPIFRGPSRQGWWKWQVLVVVSRQIPKFDGKPPIFWWFIAASQSSNLRFRCLNPQQFCESPFRTVFFKIAF